MTAAASPWAGLAKCGLKPQLVGPESTKPKVQRQQRTAFDIPAGTTSAVTLAVKPRQAAYRAGPGIVVTNAAASKADATRRKALRLSKI